MSKFIYTNVSIYKAIAEEAYHEMIELDKKYRRPKEDGTEGFIITIDPLHVSFKKSMIVRAVTAIWLEASLHLNLAKKFGVDSIDRINKKYKYYEDKLKKLGINKQEIMGKVEKFRKSRNDLMHENAYFDKDEIKRGQNEARLANEVMSMVDSALQKIN